MNIIDLRELRKDVVLDDFSRIYLNCKVQRKNKGSNYECIGCYFYIKFRVGDNLRSTCAKESFKSITVESYYKVTRLLKCVSDGECMIFIKIPNSVLNKLEIL